MTEGSPEGEIVEPATTNTDTQPTVNTEPLLEPATWTEPEQQPPTPRLIQDVRPPEPQATKFEQLPEFVNYDDLPDFKSDNEPNEKPASKEVHPELSEYDLTRKAIEIQDELDRVVGHEKDRRRRMQDDEPIDGYEMSIRRYLTNRAELSETGMILSDTDKQDLFILTQRNRARLERVINEYEQVDLAPQSAPEQGVGDSSTSAQPPTHWQAPPAPPSQSESSSPASVDAGEEQFADRHDGANQSSDQAAGEAPADNTAVDTNPEDTSATGTISYEIGQEVRAFSLFTMGIRENARVASEPYEKDGKMYIKINEASGGDIFEREVPLERLDTWQMVEEDKKTPNGFKEAWDSLYKSYLTVLDLPSTVANMGAEEAQEAIAKAKAAYANKVENIRRRRALARYGVGVLALSANIFEHPPLQPPAHS